MESNFDMHNATNLLTFTTLGLRALRATGRPGIMFACMHARTSHSRATESSSSERQTAERFMLTSNQLLTGTWKTGISRHQAALRRLYLTRLLPLSVCFAHAVNWSGVALLSQKHSQCGRNGRRDMRPSLLAFTLNSTSAQWYVGTLFSKRHTAMQLKQCLPAISKTACTFSLLYFIGRNQYHGSGMGPGGHWS